MMKLFVAVHLGTASDEHASSNNNLEESFHILFLFCFVFLFVVKYFVHVFLILKKDMIFSVWQNTSKLILLVFSPY